MEFDEIFEENFKLNNRLAVVEQGNRFNTEQVGCKKLWSGLQS
jgi:hypothetical protein